MSHQNTQLIERLRGLMTDRQLNARELASLAGVGSSFIYDILRGKSSNPTLHKLSAVARVLGTNVDYLAKGTTANNDVVDGPIVAIQTISFESSYSSEMLVHQAIPPMFFERNWIEKDLATEPTHLHVAHMPDDSMAPMLAHSDTLLIDDSQTRSQATGVYLLFQDDALVVRHIKTNHELTHISPYNKEFESRDVDTDSLKLMGRVIWFARRLTP